MNDKAFDPRFLTLNFSGKLAKREKYFFCESTRASFSVKQDFNGIFTKEN